MTISERIKQICKSRGIPISRLEKDLGFGNGYINSLKDGAVSADRLDKMSEYLNTSREYIVTGSQPEQSSVTGGKYYFSDATAEMAQKIFEDQDLRILFDAARDARPQDLQLVTEMLRRLKETNS